MAAGQLDLLGPPSPRLNPSHPRRHLLDRLFSLLSTLLRRYLNIATIAPDRLLQETSMAWRAPEVPNRKVVGICGSEVTGSHPIKVIYATT